jgi:hypothetical protein
MVYVVPTAGTVVLKLVLVGALRPSCSLCVLLLLFSSGVPRGTDTVYASMETG